MKACLVGFIVILSVGGWAQLDDFAEHPVLVSRVDEGSQKKSEVFYDVFSKINGSGETDAQSPSPHHFGWLGVCLKRSQEPCVRVYNSHTAIYDALYRSVGQR